MIRVIKPDEPPFVICYCDGCKKREELPSEEVAIFDGWIWVERKFYCPQCIQKRDWT